MSRTMREKFIQALTAMGETKVKKTFKYVVFTRKNGGHFYIGASGSLRFGPTVGTSIPVSRRFKADLLVSVHHD